MTAPTPSRTWRVVEAPHPASLDAPDAWAYLGVAAVERAVEQADTGHTDFARTPREVLVGMDNQQYTRKVRFVAVLDGGAVPPSADDVVGHAFVAMPLRSNLHLADVEVVVRPGFRRLGIGSELLARAEAVAAAAGRSTLLGDAMFGARFGARFGAGSPASPERLPAGFPTGFPAGLPDELPAAAFAARHGFAVAQVERRSQLDLPVEPELLDRLAAGSREAAGADYRLHTWRDEIPEEWLDGFALLETRMTTDPPLGGLAIEETVWDADRVRATIAQHAANGDGYLITAAEHLPTRSLAGHTMLLHPHQDGPFAFQEDTIVLREHRGHRLGMLLKAVNLQALARVRPGTERVHTFNAAENAHMLAINVALGFRPSGGSLALQRTGPGTG